jgi:hypothetical protein
MGIPNPLRSANRKTPNVSDPASRESASEFRELPKSDGGDPELGPGFFRLANNIEVNTGQAVQAERIEHSTIISYAAGMRLPCSPVTDLDVDEDSYVAPPQWDEAWTTLQSGNVVILVAEPDSGARLAGFRLLAKLRRMQALTLHLLEPDEEASSDGARVLAEQKHAHFIDITGSDIHNRWDRLCRDLVGQGDRLKQLGSYLVVRSEPERRWISQTSTLPIVRLTRPRAVDVVRRHLERQTATDRITWLNAFVERGRITEHTPPADAWHVASVICTATDLEQAYQQSIQWRDHLNSCFSEAKTVDDTQLVQRAFLVAAAGLNGCQPTAIWRATDSLLERLGYQSDGRAALADPSLWARVRMAGAEIRVDGSVDLNQHRPELDDAVLSYVWMGYPQLRQRLLGWMMTIAAAGARQDDVVGPRVAGALGRLVIGVADTTFLDVLRRAREGAVSRSFMARLLCITSCDAQIGRIVRRRLYDWARLRSMPSTTLCAVADACGRELGRVYPRIALTRLRHLAASADGLLTIAVVNAVELLARDGEQLVDVLYEVVGWLEDVERRHVGALAFLALARLADGDGGPLLLTNRSIRGSTRLTTIGWRCLLGLIDKANVMSAESGMWFWMDWAVLSSETGVQALDVLATAGHGTNAVALLRAGSRWLALASDEGDRRNRHEVIERLYESISVTPTENLSAWEAGR